MANATQSLSDNATGTAQKFYDTVDAANDVMESGRDLFQSLAPQLPTLGTQSGYVFYLPIFGRCDVQFGNIPGLNLVRWVAIFGIWFFTAISAVHIIRSGVS